MIRRTSESDSSHRVRDADGESDGASGWCSHEQLAQAGSGTRAHGTRAHGTRAHRRRAHRRRAHRRRAHRRRAHRRRARPGAPTGTNVRRNPLRDPALESSIALRFGAHRMPNRPTASVTRIVRAMELPAGARTNSSHRPGLGRAHRRRGSSGAHTVTYARLDRARDPLGKRASHFDSAHIGCRLDPPRP